MKEQSNNLYIKRWLHVNDRITGSNSEVFLTLDNNTPEEAYRSIGSQYPKFFKMDSLCKWAWIGAERLLKMGSEEFLHEGIDKNKIAIALTTTHGCLEVDRRYRESMNSFASPALFVYTLPNIMLGEISIRHGFKGAQACLATEGFEAEELHFWVWDALEHRGMEACLCGHVDVLADAKDVCLFWITREKGEQVFTPAALQQCYNERA